MNQLLKNNIKKLLPPIFISLIKKKNVYWRGNYTSWENARNECSGYESHNILDTVDKATYKVSKGDFPYERDSVLFDEIQYSWPILSGLLLAAARFGKLNVLDFGGSLGSSYFQNKKFLNKVSCRWNIVEQKNFVELGKIKYQTKELSFFNSIEECMKSENINTLFISSTLQYLNKPMEFLENIINFSFPIIIMDRLSIIQEPENRLTVQSVPSEIYSAKYPCWFFNEEKLLNILLKKYDLIESFDSFVKNETFIDGKIKSSDKGYIFLMKEIKEGIN